MPCINTACINCILRQGKAVRRSWYGLCQGQEDQRLAGGSGPLLCSLRGTPAPCVFAAASDLCWSGCPGGGRSRVPLQATVPICPALPAHVPSGPLTCLWPAACLGAGGTWAACVGVGGRMLEVLSSPTSSAWLSAVLGGGMAAPGLSRAAGS